MYIIFMEVNGVLTSSMLNMHKLMLDKFQLDEEDGVDYPELCPIVMETLRCLNESEIDLRYVLIDNPDAVNSDRLIEILNAFESAGIPGSHIIDYVPCEQGVLMTATLWRTASIAPEVMNYCVVGIQPVHLGNAEGVQMLSDEIRHLVMVDSSHGLTKNDTELIFGVLTGSVTTILSTDGLPEYKQDIKHDDDD